MLSVSSQPVDWKIGDRCYVGGTKAGTLSFIGEVKFQSGEWAGITLDEAQGKNDGAVDNIRYFQCAPNCGVFCKLSRLTRNPIEKPSEDAPPSALPPPAAPISSARASSEGPPPFSPTLSDAPLTPTGLQSYGQ